MEMSLASVPYNKFSFIHRKLTLMPTFIVFIFPNKNNKAHYVYTIRCYCGKVEEPRAMQRRVSLPHDCVCPAFWMRDFSLILIHFGF